MKYFEEIENIFARLPRRNKVEESLEEIKEHIQECNLSAVLLEITSLARMLSVANMSPHQLGMLEQALIKLSEITSKSYDVQCET